MNQIKAMTMQFGANTTTVKGGVVKIVVFALPTMMRKMVIHDGRRAELCVVGLPDGRVQVFLGSQLTQEFITERIKPTTPA